MPHELSPPYYLSNPHTQSCLSHLKRRVRPFTCSCTRCPLSDRPAFYEEDPAGGRGMQRVGGRARVSEQAGGGVCAPVPRHAAQRAGRSPNCHKVTDCRT